MARVYHIICLKKKFTCYRIYNFPSNECFMNIHEATAVALTSKTIIKALSSWSNNAFGVSKLLDLSLHL